MTTIDTTEMRKFALLARRSMGTTVPECCDRIGELCDALDAARGTIEYYERKATAGVQPAYDTDAGSMLVNVIPEIALQRADLDRLMETMRTWQLAHPLVFVKVHCTLLLPPERIRQEDKP